MIQWIINFTKKWNILITFQCKMLGVIPHWRPPDAVQAQKAMVLGSLVKLPFSLFLFTSLLKFD